MLSNCQKVSKGGGIGGGGGGDLISRFVEDVNTRQRRSFSFPELR